MLKKSAHLRKKQQQIHHESIAEHETSTQKFPLAKKGSQRFAARWPLSVTYHDSMFPANSRLIPSPKKRKKNDILRQKHVPQRGGCQNGTGYIFYSLISKPRLHVDKQSCA